MQGEEEQEYLEQHPILARVPAHQRLYIICTLKGQKKPFRYYTFWVQHREVIHVHVC